MSSFKEITKIAGAFVGVIVGAGFASGQEIMQFFTSFGAAGLTGALISSALFVFLGMALATLGQHQAATSHKVVIQAICGRVLGIFVDAMVTFFMFAITVVMLAGAGALLEQLAGIPHLWGSAAVTVLTVAIVCLDIRKVIGFIGSITPLLILMVLIVSTAAIVGRDASLETLETAAATQPRGASNWLMAALLYVSYNIVAGAPFLVIMGGQAMNRKTALWGGVVGGLLLGALMLLITGGMLAQVDKLGGVPMPMLLMAAQLSPILGVIIGVAIFGMILNTAVGVLYSFSARILEPGTARFRSGTIIAGFLAFLGSMAGFTQLVGTVYPFFGYLGFILMACTVLGWWKSLRR
ncbi:MAG: hypothetical protein GX772_05750 [Alcaligenaceae bacterium]|nr:hypothetical protein [Alcaligenaceae bacterium]